VFRGVAPARVVLFATRMRSMLLALLAATALPAPADAGPITAGAGLGLTQDEAASTLQPDHGETLWGRLGLTPRLAGQLEVTRIDTGDRGLTGYDIKTFTALAVLDLGSGVRAGHLVPILLAGAGYDRATTQGTGEIDAHHIEAGIGVEYRADGGFVLGADARLGDRTVDSNSLIVPLACCTDLWSQPVLSGGQYRSLRVTLGIRF
jgi:hypothetical protein